MTPDPAFLFLTKQHREALAGLTYAVVDRKGFLVLSGPAGSGKTTLLAWVLQKLPTDKVQSSVIVNPTLSCEDFLELAMLDFGITDVGASKARRLWTLQNFLMQGKQQGKTNVLMVDEAHKLNFELLEEIRLLGNLEYADEKLLQIILIGQSELDGVLSRPELWQLKQRVSVRLTIDPLSQEEVEHYMQHRWKVAEGKLPLPFSPEAVSSVGKWSKGIPRLINSICDNSLMLAFADKATSVSREHVESAAKDLCLIEKPTISVAKPVVPPALQPLNGTPVVARTPAMTTMDQYAQNAQKQSVLVRWASKIGWGRNG